MSKSESNQNQEKDYQFDQEQYEMLLRCDEKKDMAEWNQWRKNNLGKEIWLEDAALNQAHLEGAKFNIAHLEGVDLTSTNLEGANLILAHLEGAKLISTHLEGAKLNTAHLEGANLTLAHLEGTKFGQAHLEGAGLMFANLEGADFRGVFVNSATSFFRCHVDRGTDFREVNLDVIHIDQGTKQLLEYNGRRMNWEDWYKEHSIKKLFAIPFWWMSDYGRSTRRIISWFFGLAAAFAIIYFCCWLWFPPGIVEGLAVDSTGAVVPAWLVPLRSLYFSIVTMTTLGFGEMYAKAQSVAGHILLMLQVILGYMLLGALVTRFAVLFTAGGPAGKFSDEQREETD